MMTPEEKNIIYKIRKGEIDVNNQQIFLSLLIKGLVWNLNQHIKIRDIEVPHFIINTGDDIMYLEVKGQDHSIEPLEVSNENFVYNTIPRCMVTPEGISIPTDDLSSPYSNGMFQYESGDDIYSYTAEFRRLPMEVTVSLKYYFDSYTDSLEGIQQILTHCAFINVFDIQYLGQTIRSSYQISDQYESQYQVEFDGLSQDNKSRIVETDITIDTNMPIIYPRTAVLGDRFVKTMIHNLDTPGDDTQTRYIRMMGLCNICKNKKRPRTEGVFSYEIKSEGKIINTGTSKFDGVSVHADINFIDLVPVTGDSQWNGRRLHIRESDTTGDLTGILLYDENYMTIDDPTVKIDISRTGGLNDIICPTYLACRDAEIEIPEDECPNFEGF